MVKFILLLSSLSLLMVTIVIEYHQRTAFVTLQKLNREHSQLLIHNKQLRTKYSEHSSFFKIEQQAKKSLDMVFPKRHHRL